MSSVRIKLLVAGAKAKFLHIHNRAAILPFKSTKGNKVKKGKVLLSGVEGRVLGPL